ncbi:MAG: GspH/FimT family pseudopilin [Deltaproteobacteria bacterium]|nr:GspH/FimT family pseudopilin [Deltaproteobacteria bacterium]
MWYLIGRRGFTLLELLLTIALLGLLAVGAILLSPSISPSRLDAAAKQVVAAIQYAQQNASTRSVTCGVQFLSGGAYTVYQGTTTTPLADPLTKQNMIVTLANRYPGISLSSNYTVEFNRMGIPTTGGGGNITITDGSSTKTIQVTANTGTALMQ